MTFQEWQKTLESALAELNRVKAQAQREWDIGDDMVLRITASVPGVFVEVLSKDANGELTPVVDVVNSLSDEQARRVYGCREAFQDWHSGKSDALPDGPPKASMKRAGAELDAKVSR